MSCCTRCTRLLMDMSRCLSAMSDDEAADDGRVDALLPAAGSRPCSALRLQSPKFDFRQNYETWFLMSMIAPADGAGDGPRGSRSTLPAIGTPNCSKALPKGQRKGNEGFKAHRLSCRDASMQPSASLHLPRPDGGHTAAAIPAA